MSDTDTATATLLGKRPRVTLQGIDEDEVLRLKKHFLTQRKQRELYLAGAMERRATTRRGKLVGFAGYRELASHRSQMKDIRRQIEALEARYRISQTKEAEYLADIRERHERMKGISREASEWVPGLVKDFQRMSAAALRAGRKDFNLIPNTPYETDEYPYLQEAGVAIFKKTFEHELRGWSVEFVTGAKMAGDVMYHPVNECMDVYYCICTAL